MICSSPALEPFYWMPPCHLMTPALEWDTQSFSFFTLCLFTTEVVSQHQSIMKPNGQRKATDCHTDASPGIKISRTKYTTMFPNKLEMIFYHCAYIFILKFCNSSLPLSVLFTFFIVHIFFGNMVISLCVRLFFSSLTLMKAQLLSNLLYVGQMICFLSQRKNMTQDYMMPFNFF